MVSREEFGRTVRATRQRTRVKLIFLSQEIGYSMSTIMLAENGRRTVSLMALKAMGEYLGIEDIPTDPPRRDPYGPPCRIETMPDNEPKARPGAYLILNKVNGKAYVGFSVNVRDRWIKHSAGRLTSEKLRIAIDIEGHANFIFVPIFYTISPWRGIGSPARPYAQRVEAVYMRIYNSVDEGYNGALTGEATYQAGLSCTIADQCASYWRDDPE